MTIEWQKTIIDDDLVLWESQPNINHFLQVEDSPYFGISWLVFIGNDHFTDPDRYGTSDTVDKAKELAEGAYNSAIYSC